MAYEVSWIVQHHVLYTRFLDEITLDDFRGVSTAAADMLDLAYASDSSGIIIGIVDLSNASLGPLLRYATAVVKDISSMIDPRVWKAKPGFVVLITVSETAKLVTSLIIHISKQPMTTVGSIEEALTVVRSMYPELSTLFDADRHDDQESKTAPGGQ